MKLYLIWLGEVRVESNGLCTLILFKISITSHQPHDGMGGKFTPDPGSWPGTTGIRWINEDHVSTFCHSLAPL